MRKPNQKSIINMVLILAVCIVTSAGMLSYYQFKQLRSTNEWVMHTYQVISRARLVLISLLRADVSAGQYLVSGDTKNLQDIEGAVLFIKNSLAQLKQITSDNSVQQDNLNKFLPIVNEKIKQLNLLTKTYQSSAPTLAVANSLNTINIKLSDDVINYMNDVVVNEEVFLLSERIEELNTDADKTSTRIIVSTIMSDLLLLLCFVMINHLLLQRSRAERSRDEFESHLRKIIDGSSDLIAAVDTNLNLIAFNKAYSKKYYQTFGNKIALGDNIRVALSKMSQNQEILNAWERAINGDELTLVSRWQPSDDTYYEITFNPIHDGDGHVIGAMHIMRDISERMKVDQLKNEFVSIVSHELRTPLTSIRGSLGLLVGGAVGNFDDKTKKMLNIAYSNSERLIRLINDILDIEKIEIGKVDFQLAPVDLQNIIDEAIVSIQPYCEKFNVTIKLKRISNVVMVYADYGRLMQVLTNLISNAIKFSLPGGEVSISILPDFKNVRVSVTDQGKGIPEDFKSQIFQKFAQADPSSIRKQSGTGLGLSICKAIVEKLNGHIGFITEQDKGSTFYFDLPIWKEGNPKPTLIKATPQITPSVKKVIEVKQGKPLKILYVEDDLDLSQIVINILQQEAELVSVQTTQQALAVLGKQKFDLVLLDLVLPDGYGADLIPEVTKQQIPIVIFSAYELPQKFVPFVAKTLIKSKTSNQELIQAIRIAGPDKNTDSSDPTNTTD
jgi:signal transduction histidine kinase/CheY-like chemotaxis protein